MNNQKELVKMIYRYVGFAAFCIILNLFDIFNPIPDILALVVLLIALFSVGKYTRPNKNKRRKA